MHLVGLRAMPLHFAAGIGIGLLAYLAIERPLMAYFHRRRYRHGVLVPSL